MNINCIYAHGSHKDQVYSIIYYTMLIYFNPLLGQKIDQPNCWDNLTRMFLFDLTMG